MSCPTCHCPRGTNAYCWGHVNSDGSGFLLPFISDTDLIKFELRRERHVKKYGKAITLNEALRGGGK